MQDIANILSALAAFPFAQLVLVAIVAVACWYIWVSATKAQPKPDESSKPASMLALSNMRAEIQGSLSERDRLIHERLNKLNDRVSYVEGQIDGADDPPPRHRRRRSAD